MGRQVQLIDGRLVDSASEAWRHECEARTLPGLPTTNKRKAALQGIAGKRGPAAAAALRGTMTTLWAHDQAAILRGILTEERRAAHLERCRETMGAEVGALIERIYIAAHTTAANDKGRAAA